MEQKRILYLTVLGGALAGTLLFGGCSDVHQPARYAPPSGDLWTFDDDKLGGPPPGWRICETNPTVSTATWKVAHDLLAPSRPQVLALTRSENYGGTYNLALAENSSYRDLDLRVRVKAVRGEEDQGGGPVWRCQDENNYYVCRFNPLEGNYRVYVVRDGQRRQLKSIKVETRRGRWYTVRVVMYGDFIKCYLDGVQMLQAADSTIAEGGHVGLWTKADAVTSFDDLEVRPLDEE